MSTDKTSAFLSVCIGDRKRDKYRSLSTSLRCGRDDVLGMGYPSPTNFDEPGGIKDQRPGCVAGAFLSSEENLS
jgi:hypothetical protein